MVCYTFRVQSGHYLPIKFTLISWFIVLFKANEEHGADGKTVNTNVTISEI